MAEQWTLPEIDLAACTRCGECVTQCPTQAVEMQAVGQALWPVIVRPADCTYCTICEGVCPVGAITCAFEIAWDTYATE